MMALIFINKMHTFVSWFPIPVRNYNLKNLLIEPFWFWAVVYVLDYLIKNLNMKLSFSALKRALSMAGVALLLMAVIVPAASAAGSGSSFAMAIKLNPECKFKRLSNGSVVIMAKNDQGGEVKHEFNDFYADLLTAAYKKQRTDFILESFAKKYYLSDDECRREIKHAMNVLADWNILLRDDRLASR